MASIGTKSIDVGSMFLMDLSINESELNNDQSNPLTVENNPVFQVGLNYRQTNESMSNYANQYSLSTTTTTQSIVYHRRENQQHEYSGNSLDNLAYAIDVGDQCNKAAATNRKQSSLVTIVEPQPPPELTGHQSSSSLSDESFVASEGNSLSVSYSASSGPEGDERDSITTREDSGVLDIKDLDSQLNNSYDNGHEDDKCQRQQNQGFLQEKPISDSTMATNLINKSIHSYHRNNTSFNTTSHPNQPTDNSKNNNYYHNHNHNNHRGQSRRVMSASLPIQVPARQMKKDLNKSKLNMMIKNSAAICSTRPDEPGSKSSSANRSYNNRSAAMPAGVDDFEEFLEQEYNENHHNHYPIDEYDNEHLRAEENPMKLFESIQALARSLHEDTELFGSLPPKRMLESPIRPLALV